MKQNDLNLIIVCEGTGPSVDLARKYALESCLVTATNQLNGDFDVQSLSLESEKSANYHSEISSSKTVQGLFCKPENEYIEKLDSQQKVWLKCNYDIGKAKIVTIQKSPEKSTKSNINQNSIIQHAPDASDIPKYQASTGEQKKIVQSETRSLIVTSVPKCEEILIRGKNPRVISCDEMPKALIIFPNDSELIVRANGFLPKHIKLNQRSPSGNQSSESLEVYLAK